MSVRGECRQLQLGLHVVERNSGSYILFLDHHLSRNAVGHSIIRSTYRFTSSDLWIDRLALAPHGMVVMSPISYAVKCRVS